MIEDNRYCIDILMQLRAIRSAVKAVEANILKKHLDYCVMQAIVSPEEKKNKIAEITDLFRRLEV